MLAARPRLEAERRPSRETGYSRHKQDCSKSRSVPGTPYCEMVRKLKEADIPVVRCHDADDDSNNANWNLRVSVEGHSRIKKWIERQYGQSENKMGFKLWHGKFA